MVLDAFMLGCKGKKNQGGNRMINFLTIVSKRYSFMKYRTLFAHKPSLPFVDFMEK